MTWDLPLTPSWAGTVRLSDGYERFVQRFGTGAETIVALHGGPGSNQSTLWPLASIADEQLQIVLYDQLGSGRSDCPMDNTLWTVENFVSEFGELTAALGLDEVHVLGQSWGGMLGLECALADPARLRSLVLCNSLASVKTAEAGYREILDSVPADLREEVAAAALDGSNRTPARRALLELYACHVRRCYPFDLERSCQEFIERYRALTGKIGPAYEVMWGRNEFAPTGLLKNWDVTSRLDEIAVPALVICGAYDEVSPACSAEIVEGIADSQWIILGQSSHAIFYEADIEVALGAIRGFVLEGGGRAQAHASGATSPSGVV